MVILFMIVHNCKQLWYPPTGKWINKLCYICTMEYYTAIGKNEKLMHEKHRWNSETLCWVKEAWHRMCTVWFYLHEVQREEKLICGNRNQSSCFLGDGRCTGLTGKGQENEGNFWSGRKILKLHWTSGYHVNTIVKTHRTVHLRYMHFIVYSLYLKWKIM